NVQAQAVQVPITVGVGGEDRVPGAAQDGDDRVGGRRQDHVQVEQAPRRRSYALAVVRVDRLPGEDHRTGAGRVGSAQYRAGVARIADLGEYGHEPGAARQRHV